MVGCIRLYFYYVRHLLPPPEILSPMELCTQMIFTINPKWSH